MATFTRYSGTNLFLSSEATAATARAGYLLPAGDTPPPDPFGVDDALNKYPGWFILFPDLPADPTTFIQQAQIYLANAARADALVAWFTNPESAAKGLAGYVLTAPRVSGKAPALTKPGLVVFSNVTIGLKTATTVAVSGDGNGLTFTAASGTNAMVVTPFGARKSVTLPMTGAATLSLLSPAATSGCLGFGLSIDQAAATALDLGLRMFTAPKAGGYTATVLYPVFDLSQVRGGVAVAATIDPLSPLDESRSFFTFSSPGTAVPSTYRTPVGGALTLAPHAGTGLVFADRVSGVDANGKPIVRPGQEVLYLVPKGTFDLAPAKPLTKKVAGATNAAPNLANNLMCGLSGVEYLSLAGGTTMQFVTGQNAFASTLRASDPKAGTTRVFGALTDAAKTSWAVLSVPGSSTYYAQPDSSVMHQPPGGASSILCYKELPFGTLPPSTRVIAGGDTSFPLLPYPAVQVGPGITIDEVTQFETQVVAPRRKQIISGLVTPVTNGSGTANTTSPRGLVLNLTGNAWTNLTLAVSPGQVPADQHKNLLRSPKLLLDNITGDLLDALQSNQLFLVVTSAQAMLANCTIPYALTAERIDVLQNVVKLDPGVITALKNIPTPWLWPDEASFDAALKTALGTAYTANQPKILPYAGDFSLFVTDWEFDLSPWRWADHGTILIFKFCGKQLGQLTSDTSQWVHGSTFNASPGATQQQIQTIFQNAKDKLAGGDTDFDYFVNDVLTDPNWNGILALNAEVPLSGLPPQLEGLAAGIDPAQFQAHHLGINVTPVDTSGTTLTGRPSSVFGLIHYEDDTELGGTGVDYGFKVNSLKVLLANSEIIGFSSVIEVLINKLFGEPAQQLGVNTNCLKLNGYYQQSGGVGSYSFVTGGPTAYQIASQVLDEVAISQARFVTITSNDPNSTDINSRFNLQGTISFKAQPGFDLFSYGPDKQPPPTAPLPGLSYTNLSIDMEFDEATPSYRTFTFDAQHILLDAAISQARANALASHFPMKLTGLYQGLGDVTPDKLGYMPVDSPVQGSTLSAPWFGLQYDLDLGTPGALAAQVGFTAGLLMAWAPNPSGASIYIGLTLPGVSGGQRAISLQGILSLVFGDVKFIAQPPTYILELTNIALKFFSLTFPPNGQTSVVMFGNPNAQTSGALGWYACYLKAGAGQGGGGNKQLTKT